MSEWLREAVEADAYDNMDYLDYKDDDLAGVSEAYLDYISSERYYD